MWDENNIDDNGQVILLIPFQSTDELSSEVKIRFKVRVINNFVDGFNFHNKQWAGINSKLVYVEYYLVEYI